MGLCNIYDIGGSRRSSVVWFRRATQTRSLAVVPSRCPQMLWLCQTTVPDVSLKSVRTVLTLPLRVHTPWAQSGAPRIQEVIQLMRSTGIAALVLTEADLAEARTV